MDKDQLILALQERRCALESARVAAVEHLNCIRGGIAEVELLLEQLAPASEPAPEAAEEREG